MSSSAPAESVLSSQHNLPVEVTRLVGRERDIADIKQLAARTRLLTLTGVGGIGKTRLALRVAAELRPDFPDGAWLVQLAPLGDSDLLVRAVATAVGVRDVGEQSQLAALVTALASRRLLLVLDNCEHVIGACAGLVETLLGACPALRVLATSREPVRIPGEVVWRVRPLALPPDRVADPERITQAESVALFAERACARRPGFTVDAGNADAVAAICRRLGGLPLALELAAAQVEALSPQQIAERLDGALRLLTGGNRTLPRQETLRAALGWSHALLTQSEQLLFRRLAAFAGAFTVEAAECVCGGPGLPPGDVLPVLAALVGKSLAEPRPGGPQTRYVLLEPVRQYAREQLAGATIWPANAADYERALIALRSQPDQAGLDEGWAEGRALPADRTIAELLAEEPPAVNGDSAGHPGPDLDLHRRLTRREREVALLVAQGLTNREIGARLFITEGTARLHVKHILHKLGFSSRAQVAAWAVGHQLTGAPPAR